MAVLSSFLQPRMSTPALFPDSSKHIFIGVPPGCWLELRAGGPLGPLPLSWSFGDASQGLPLPRTQAPRSGGKWVVEAPLVPLENQELSRARVHCFLPSDHEESQTLASSSALAEVPTR